MDRNRELTYTLGSFRAMEDLVHRWAKKTGLNIRDIVGPEIIPAGVFGNKEPIHNPAMISTVTIMRNLGMDSFLSIALWGALRKDDPKIPLEEVDSIYEAYLEKGGDRDDLIAVLIEAYARARNPHKLQQARELEKVQQEAAELAKNGPGEKPPDKQE